MIRRIFFFLILGLMSGRVYGQQDMIGMLENSELLDNLAPEMRLLFTLTAMSFIPAMMIAMTAFTRIVIVLSMLRQALGLMQTPPNIIIITLAFFLTWYTMDPVFQEVKENAVTPYLQEEQALSVSLQNGYAPFKDFMISQTREEDFAVILDIANQSIPDSPDAIAVQHLVPAFLLSELRTAFQIAFVIFIPFLMIDLIVASTLMALGMIMVPPITIAMPLKIMLFVLIDGWTLVTQSLVGSFFT